MARWPGASVRRNRSGSIHTIVRTAILLTNIEAYLDLYLVTGEKRYFEAAHGAWELYRAHWQQAGGSISIIEFENDPPDSNYLRQKLGELCGSSFWVFLSQRFQLLDPENEQYATEIEKSIYNVGLANQDGGNGFRYHTDHGRAKGKIDPREHLLRRAGNTPDRFVAGTYLFHGFGRSVSAPLRAIDGSMAAERARNDAIGAHAVSARQTAWRQR